MPLDLSKIAPDARASYIAVGAGYGVEEVAAQAEATLGALKSYAERLAPFGFGVRDRARLGEVRAALAPFEAQASRSPLSDRRLFVRQVLVAAKAERRQARTILRAALRELREESTRAAREAAAAVEMALLHSGTSGASISALREQLGLLGATLRLPRVAEALSDRGGTAVEMALADALDNLAEARVPEREPASADEVNLLAGLIVELCRAARRSARCAAQRSLSPPLSAAFALTALDPPAWAGHTGAIVVPPPSPTLPAGALPPFVGAGR